MSHASSRHLGNRAIACATSLLAGLLLTLSAASVGGQPLPKVRLRPELPKLTLQLPVGMEEAPDGSGRFFILEQDGRIVVVTNGTDGSEAREFLNITARRPHVAVEDGLLGFAFHPQFKTNGLFCIYYTLHEPEHSILSEWRVSASDPHKADPKTERIILDVPQPFQDHKGGQLGFGPDGFLYVGLGDGGHGNDPFNNGQNTSSLLGKILRLDVNARDSRKDRGVQQALAYGIPKDNPFATEPDFYEHGVCKEIWAYGFRNPWRFSWDRRTGEMWAGDVGQDTWEEINLIVKGGNYGWCIREGAHHFKPGPEGARYIDPVVEYPHDPKLLPQSRVPDHTVGMCVITGYVYRGQKYSSLQGVFLYGDYVLGTIWGFRYKDGNLAERGTLLAQPKNITSFAQDHEGELYVLTHDGHVWGIETE